MDTQEPASSTTEPCIGIDLGTTHSLVSYFRDGKPTLLPSIHGGFLTPSVVGVLPNGEVVVGQTAKELRVTAPERCGWCFKRSMGQDRRFRIASHE